MCCRSIPDFINRFDCSVDCRIKANGIICTGYIFIDRTGNTDNRHLVLGIQGTGPSETTVPANHDQAFHTMLLQVSGCFTAAFFRHKILAARRFQHSATHLYYIGNVSGFHRENIIIDKPLVTITDTHYSNAMKDSGTHYSAYCRIHTRCISSRGQHRNLLYHKVLFLIISFRYGQNHLHHAHCLPVYRSVPT
ncbi:hypothetical protein D3C80_1230340 [compost metagenome]